MEAGEILQLSVSALTLVSLIIFFYKMNRDPDEKIANRQTEIETTCRLRTKQVNKSIGAIEEDIKLIKVNHLTHIEKSLNSIQGDLREIKGVVKYLNKKNE